MYLTSLALTMATNDTNVVLPTLQVTQSSPHMKPGGFYNEHSTWQADAQKGLLPSFKLASQTVSLPIADEGYSADRALLPFQIADLGCSQGKNSLTPINMIIGIVRQRQPSLPVTVLHVDLPDNDFTSLFHELGTKQSYTATHSNVYPSAVGRSYYERIAPQNSLHLVMALVTLHWQPTAPYFGNQAWHAHHPLALPSARLEAAQLAQHTLQDFLLQRGAEVVTGGKLIMSMVARDHDSGTGVHSFGSKSDQKEGMAMFEFMDVILIQLKDEGLITAEDIASLNIPMYFRTEQEVQDVLSLPAINALYTVNKLQKDWVEDPHGRQHMEGKMTLEKAVASSVEAWKAVLEPCYLAPFRARPEVAKQVATAVGSRMYAMLLGNPSRVRFAISHLHISLTKK